MLAPASLRTGVKMPDEVAHACAVSSGRYKEDHLWGLLAATPVQWGSVRIVRDLS